MRIETHEGTYADPATIEDISRVVASLTAVGEAFVVLSDDRYETYAQAAGTVGEDFIVEYRDGGAGDHFRGDRRVAADDLVALLTTYLHRVPDWSSAITWHRVDVDFNAANASA